MSGHRLVGGLIDGDVPDGVDLGPVLHVPAGVDQVVQQVAVPYVGAGDGDVLAGRGCGRGREAGLGRAVVLECAVPDLRDDLHDEVGVLLLGALLGRVRGG